ncbi:MAG: hypothetical protein JXR59_10710, partial [Desulfuromonadaceae bacterium]|nr:hypothetical protein [Desulfuromonadaceae bacterium]
MTFETLEHLILFVLDIRLWSGRKALKEEDLAAGGMDVRQLPPNSLVRIPAESDHDSDRKATTVPAGKRPAFRFD